MSIQSKLLLMLLSVTVLSAVVVGVIGYINGSDSLRDAAYQKLTVVREARASAITHYFSTTSDSLVVYTRGRTTIDAVTDFTAGFDALQSTTPSPADEASLDRYYSDTFTPKLEKATGQTSDPAAFVPTSSAQQYLQLNYTVPFTNFDDAIANDDAGDGARGPRPMRSITTTSARW